MVSSASIAHVTRAGKQLAAAVSASVAPSAAVAPAGGQPPTQNPSMDVTAGDQRRIDEENRQLLQSMTPVEVCDTAAPCQTFHPSTLPSLPSPSFSPPAPPHTLSAHCDVAPLVSILLGKYERTQLTPRLQYARAVLAQGCPFNFVSDPSLHPPRPLARITTRRLPPNPLFLEALGCRRQDCCTCMLHPSSHHAVSLLGS